MSSLTRLPLLRSALATALAVAVSACNLSPLAGRVAGQAAIPASNSSKVLETAADAEDMTGTGVAFGAAETVAIEETSPGKVTLILRIPEGAGTDYRTQTVTPHSTHYSLAVRTPTSLLSSGGIQPIPVNRRVPIADLPLGVPLRFELALFHMDGVVPVRDVAGMAMLPLKPAYDSQGSLIPTPVAITLNQPSLGLMSPTGAPRSSTLMATAGMGKAFGFRVRYQGSVGARYLVAADVMGSTRNLNPGCRPPIIVRVGSVAAPRETVTIPQGSPVEVKLSPFPGNLGGNDDVSISMDASGCGDVGGVTIKMRASVPPPPPPGPPTPLREGKAFFAYHMPDGRQARIRFRNLVAGPVTVTVKKFNFDGGLVSASTYTVAASAAGQHVETGGTAGFFKITSTDRISVAQSTLNADHLSDDDVAFGSGREYPMFLPRGLNFATIISHANKNAVQVSFGGLAPTREVVLQEGEILHIPELSGNAGETGAYVKSPFGTSAVFGHLEDNVFEQAYSVDMKNYFVTLPRSGFSQVARYVVPVAYQDNTTIRVKNYNDGIETEYTLNAGQQLALAFGEQWLRVRASSDKVFGLYVRGGESVMGTQHTSVDAPGKVGRSYWIHTGETGSGANEIHILSLAADNQVSVQGQQGALTNVRLANPPSGFTLQNYQLATIRTTTASPVRITSTAPVLVYSDLPGGPEHHATLVPVADAGVEPPQVVTSTFDSSRDGWTNFGGVQFPVPNFLSSGGNPGGYIENSDGSGASWLWVAPSKFLGTKSSLFGKALTFDLKQSATDSQFEGDDVLMSGGGLTIAYQFDRPDTSWTSYWVPLSESGWLIQGTQTAVTEAQFKAVLGGITSLKIRGEFRSGEDTCGLDNVVLGSDAPKPAPVTVSGSFGGHRVFDNAGLMWVGSGNGTSRVALVGTSGSIVNPNHGIEGNRVISSVLEPGNDRAFTVGDDGSGRIRQLTMGGSFVREWALPSSANYGVTSDGNGIVYVSSFGTGALFKVNTGTNQVSTLASGMPGLWGISVDSAGNVYGTSGLNGPQVWKVAPDGTRTVLATLPSNPGWGGAAVDSAGNVFVAGNSTTNVYRVTQAGSVSVFAGLPGYGGGDTVMDAGGNLYVASYTGSGAIARITPGGAVSTFTNVGGTGRSHPTF